MCRQWCCSWFFSSVNEREGASSTTAWQPWSDSGLHCCAKLARQEAPPCCLEWGLMWEFIKCTLMVAKGKPPAITSYITFPELVMFCFAKSVGSSGTHHFQLRSCNKQGHRFNFQSAFYWLTYSYTRIHWSSSILSFSVSLSLSLSCVWPFILLTGLKYMNIS